MQWLASKASLDVRSQVEEISAFYEQQAVQAQRQQAKLLDEKVQYAVQSALHQAPALPTSAPRLDHEFSDSPHLVSSCCKSTCFNTETAVCSCPSHTAQISLHSTGVNSPC